MVQFAAMKYCNQARGGALVLSVLLGLLGSQLAFAADLDLSGHEETINQFTPQYGYCVVAVLLDQKYHQALAFLVGIDPSSAMRLILINDPSGDATIQRASLLSFDSPFSAVIVSNENVFGETTSPTTGLIKLVPAYRNGLHQTVQGMTGEIYVLDARPQCKED